MPLTQFEKKVHSACAEIPPGKVSTYSRLARLIGRPKAARAVGNALNRNQFSRVPCHRVVRNDRRPGGFARGAKEKIRLLKREGVRIELGRIPRRFFI